MIELMLAGAATALIAEAPSEEPKTTEVMVLGVYHFANPGLDMINVDAGDMLAPGPQAEIKALVDALAKWKPTKIVLEAQPKTDDLSMVSYGEEAAKRIAEDANEHYQVGYRLGLMLGHQAVYGFDEQPSEGEPNYFPMDKVQAWAKSNGKEAEMGALFGWAQNYIMGKAKQTAQCSVAQKLIFHNSPDTTVTGHSKLYYGVMQFGDADNQAGAELNSYWYLRNAKMFAKIDMIAEPGDRVLVIVGSGHKYWLDHFAKTVPGYALVDARPYLKMAGGPCSEEQLD